MSASSRSYLLANLAYVVTLPLAVLTLPRTVTVDARTDAVIYGNVYTQLLEYIIPADLVLYVLTMGALIILRRKKPNLERPYRTWGYPFVPVIYMVLAMLLVVDLAYLAPSTSGTGYLLVLSGIPSISPGAELPRRGL